MSSYIPFVKCFSIMTMLVTLRLHLRPWRESDFEPFSVLNADPRVMKYFPSCLSQTESNALAQLLQNAVDTDDWGFWVLERQQDARFIGFVGLQAQPHRLPFSPCIEIGWRLAYDTWGQGYATEAAVRCLQFGFDYLGLQEIVSFTTRSNMRSQRLMQRLGMLRNITEDFIHPSLPPDHPLAQHVLYRLSRRWSETDNRSPLEGDV